MIAVLILGVIPSAAAVGPSFACTPAPQDALSRLTCSDNTLAHSEIRLVQTYYALRQFVGSEGQKPLKSEFLSFMVNTRRVCGLPPVEPNRDQTQIALPANAAGCVAAAYDVRRTNWATRLSGPAAEEAARAPEQNIALQGKLQSLGFIPKSTAIDGVFGTGTRTALLAWQHEKMRPETGFASDGETSILLADGPAEPPDPYARWRVKPLAETEFKGHPATIAYKTLQVSMDSATIETDEACKALNGGLLSLTFGTDEHNPCHTVVARIRVDGGEVLSQPVAVVVDDEKIEWLHIRVAIRKLDTETVLPQVVITGYSGGAHCCTATAIATPGTDGAWRFVNLDSIDGDAGFNFLDLTAGNSVVLVDGAPGFNYAFSSYAGSFTPTRIRRFGDAKLEEVARDPRYRGFLVQELRQMEETARKGLWEPNGYYAGWVAQKILVGELPDAWRTMLASYDRKATNGLDDCMLDKRVWSIGSYGEKACPEGQGMLRPFPEALALRLVDLGYLTPEQSTQLGIDPARIQAARQAATVRYEEEMVQGWFVITHAGNCSLARSPESPAALVTYDRSQGMEDDIQILATDSGDKPLVVRVDKPQANGLVSTLTFYRGSARCESSRQKRKEEMEILK